MSYVLCKGFLYESSVYTTLKLIPGEAFMITKEDNIRTLKIEFPEGESYSRLKNIPGFKVFKEDNLIEPFEAVLRKEILTIGENVYYFKNGISRFSQLYNTVLDTAVYDYDKLCFVSINRDVVPDVDEYVRLLNDSGVVYCVIKDKDNFSIYNYHDIDVSRGYVDESDSQSCTDFKYLAVSATDTNSSFLNHCKDHYPEIEVVSEFSDLTNLNDNENGYMVVKFGLPNWQMGEFTTHLFTEYNPLYPKYGRYGVYACRGLIDFITNDWDKYMEMRYDFLLMRKLYTHNKFVVYPEKGENFNAIVVFDSSIDDNIDRSPSDKVVETSRLYSFKISFTIYSYLVENYLEFPYITKILTNLRAPSNKIERQVLMKPGEESVEIIPPKETPPDAEFNPKDWP